MRPRVTGILLLVAAALAAFVYLYEIRGSQRRVEAEAQAKRLFPGRTAQDVQAISLTTTDGRPARIQRAGEGWELVEPLAFPADGVALDGIASALAELASEGEIADPQPPDVYGLGGSARVVRFRAGEADLELRLGGKTPVGANTYVSIGADARVFTVPTYRVNAFERSLDDLRERRLMRFDREAIERIEASWVGGGVVLAKRDGGWHLVEPLEAPADPTTIETLLSDLNFLRAEGFLDEPPPEDELGLDPPAFRAVLTAAPEGGGEPPRFELVVGAPLEEESRAARGANGILYRIAAARLDDFPRRVSAYRLRELARFVSSDAYRLELAFQEPEESEPVTVVAERTDEGWRSEPEKLAPGTVSNLVSELSRLRGEDIVAEAMGAAELAGVGLSPPRVRLRVLGKASESGEAPELAEVHLGVGDANRGIFARVPDRDTVYLLDYALAEELPLSLEALRNRFVSKEEPDGEPEPEASEPTGAPPDAD